MNALRERILLAALGLGIPLLGFALVLRPSFRRLDALHQRIRAAETTASPRRPYTPVGQEERAVLEDPSAPWRARIPRIVGDADRLAQVDRVVNDLGSAFKAKGVSIASVHAAWDPVTIDFTLPGGLERESPPAPSAQDAPELQLAAWVLEVEIPGPTEDLFRALAAIPDIRPIMEPVGLRWGGVPSASGAGRQVLLLRNYYLKPGDSHVIH
jgi:hypothetical protein